MFKNFKKLFFLLPILGLIILSSPVLADVAPFAYDTSDTSDISKISFLLSPENTATGFTADAFDNQFKIIFPTGAIVASTDLSCEINNDNLATPWNLKKVSQVYQYDFSDDTAYNATLPLELRISYDSADNNYKRIFFYDQGNNTWRELPSIDNTKEKYVSAKTSLVYARVAVFSDPTILSSGKASWYAYKGGDFAASPDFPKGSRLRVYNLANKKFVDITVNDYGPDRVKHPDRVVDLDKKAFLKIASSKDGIINVKVDVLSVPADAQGDVLGINPSLGATIAPTIKSKASFAIDEKTGQVLWDNNGSTTRVLASLSKLMAIKVFLDQKIPLDKVVTYKKQDELYNYKYCQPVESASLKVKDGETMKVSDLLYAALVGSANNAVESLVRVSGLTRVQFINKMNEVAKSLGALNTNFVEPTGLSPENVSTAEDYAIIAKEASKNSLIEKISATPKYTFKTINTKKVHTLYNTNDFLRDGLFAAYNDLTISGSKTGYLNEAGYNLMTRAQGLNGEKVLAIVMGAVTKNQATEEIKELLRYGIRQIDNLNDKIK